MATTSALLSYQEETHQSGPATLGEFTVNVGPLNVVTRSFRADFP